MAANKIFRLGPVILSATTTTNILNPATATGGVNGGSSSNYIILRHIRVLNKTSSAATVSLWVSTTGDNSAGKEFAWQGTSVPANSYVDWYGSLRLDAADYLVGGAGTGSALTINAEGEIGVAG